MPTYLYKRVDNNKVIELVMTISEMEKRQFDRDEGQFILLEDGISAQRIYTPIGGHLPQNWPIVSTAAGVGVEQVREAMEIDRKAGVKTDYTQDGDVIFRDPQHRKNWLKAHSMYDRSAYC